VIDGMDMKGSDLGVFELSSFLNVTGQTGEIAVNLRIGGRKAEFRISEFPKLNVMIINVFCLGAFHQIEGYCYGHKMLLSIRVFCVCIEKLQCCYCVW
jgi:hypothetical protein